MLVVTARLFYCNQLVGYQLSDGNQTREFTKQQAWLYAKNKQILNVVATGTEADPGLSGTNGFELKKLPEVKWGTSQIQVPNNLLGHNLIITAILYDGFYSIGDIISGYKIKNVGQLPIEYTRITATPDHTETRVILYPNEDIHLNKAEIAALAHRSEVGTNLKNGYLHKSEEQGQCKFEYLSNCELRLADFGEGLDRLDIRLELDTETINKYFCPPKQRQPSQVAIIDDKTKHIIRPKKTILGMFKR